ncbi:MAG: cytochrome c [Verrucomicrobiota bacterium]
MKNRTHNKWLLGGSLIVLLAGSTGCELRQRMYDQPRYEPYEQSDFFGDDMSARLPVEGTVPRGHLRDDDHLYTGKVDGKLVTTFPVEITEEVMARGQTRYQFYGTPCHGQSGDGEGMIVKRGYKQPPSYHEQRLVDQSVGYYYEVITKGFGIMPAYAYQLKPEDRWAVVAYVRALQRSRMATVDDLPDDIKETLLAEKE